MIEIIKEKKDIEQYFNVLKKRGAVNSGDFSNTSNKFFSTYSNTKNKFPL